MGASVIQKVAKLGAWVTIAGQTVYQAATDGFLMGVSSNSAGQFDNSYAFTDSSATPTTMRTWSESQAIGSGGSMMSFTPVRKGDYYKVVNNGSGATSAAAFFIPLA